MSDREKIARIVDPEAWDYYPDDVSPTARQMADEARPGKQKRAFAKADAILALFPSPDAATVERLRDIRETLEEAEYALHHCYNVQSYPGDGTSQQDHALMLVRECLRALPQAGGEGPRPQVVGRVTGKIYEGDQVPGMLHAICHACGLKDYPCTNPDCPNASSITNGDRSGE